MDMRNHTRYRKSHRELPLETNKCSSTNALLPVEAIEVPGPDGIRWGLVRRIRAEIAAGTYDDEQKWAEAESLLFDQLQGLR